MLPAMVKQPPRSLVVLVGSGIGMGLAALAFVVYGRTGTIDLDVSLMTGSAAGAYVGLLHGIGAHSGRTFPRERVKSQ